MSAREQLQREAALLPDGVAQRLLDYLHALPTSDLTVATPQPTGDYFQSYWSQWYGCCEGEEWAEPSELPFEKRETW